MTSSAPTSRENARTILLAWELGGGYGHAGTLARIGRALADRGYRLVFAHRDLVGVWPLIRDLPGQHLVAPSHLKPVPEKHLPFLAASFTDILGVSGYSSADLLLPLLRAWDGLLDQLRPDLIVTDFSPTLALAARGKVPILDVGQGYTQPITHLPEFPKFVDDQKPTFSSEEILAVVREVQLVRGAPVPKSLPGIYSEVEKCLCVLPEMDPFQDLRPGVAIGPLEELPEPSPLPSKPWFFGYLSTSVTSTEIVLTLLREAGFEGGAYIRPAKRELSARLREKGIEIFDQPPPLAEVLSRARVFVHHAGLNSAQVCLAAGRPQLVFPEHLEHELNAAALYHLGVAHALTREFPAEDVIEGMRQLMFDRKFEEKAAEVARKIQATGPWDPLPKVLEICEKLLQTWKPTPVPG